MPDSKKIWDERFEHYHSQGVEVSIFLSNGIRLTGKILKFDETAVVLTSPKDPQGAVVQRSVIATLMRDTPDQHKHQERAPGKR